MDITVVCTDRRHPVFPHLIQWCERQRAVHYVTLNDTIDGLPGGDLLFLISCSRIVGPEIRSTYRHALVIHSSNLPEGRGWSPLTWQLLEGRSNIAVTLLCADDPVDSGDIWARRWLHFEGHELFDEINSALFETELELMDYAVNQCGQIQPEPQDDSKASWYPRRRPEDSRLDPHKTLAEQFDLLRVVDPVRYPAFFEFRGHRYEVTICKKD